LFDRTKPTAGCSANGGRRRRRRGRRRRRKRRRRRRRIRRRRRRRRRRRNLSAVCPTSFYFSVVTVFGDVW
jgi:hypothetical protein